ncbi:uroporphyrinogen decarboxylase isoform X2 [Hetaerina americana]|uniref:uroporphyrinogen decarboxylase isoform X2 n=1 Tax=Hetaerina americana TaxID=62018 RepID=UPI003A7F2A0A
MQDFPPLVNDTLLRAARGDDVERIPVWVMRQAGRYLPEFRALRAEHNFFKICQTPELVAEVTLQPIRRYDLDAAIIFSDILVVPQALGMVVEMKPGVGPVLPEPLSSPSDIEKLKFPVDVKEKLGYVFEGITLTRHKLEGKVPLIGFSGAPWTLMCYMIEGGGSKTMSKAKNWLYQHPNSSHELLKILTDVTVDYLVEQVIAGAQLLQVFESNAEYLAREQFEEFSIPYFKTISEQVKKQLEKRGVESVPMTIFAKGAHHSLKKLGNIGFDIVGLDWTMIPNEARNQVGPHITLQGNLDPCALYGSKEAIKKLTHEMLSAFGKSRYIANLGHGIYPDVDPEHLKVFIDTIHEYKWST